MKTFIVQWEEGCAGGRYALIQARSLDAAWHDADSIDGFFRIMELKIPDNGAEYGGRYMEINAPAEPFEGPSLDALGWNDESLVG